MHDLYWPIEERKCNRYLELAIITQVTNDRACMSKGGSTSKYHTTKEGKKAKKGLWYNIAMKRKRGEKMRKKGAKGAPTEAAIKKSQS